MFGGLRLGYLLLLALVAGIWLSAVALTDYPLSAYASTVGRGRYMVLWLLPPVLWFCWLGIVVIGRRSARPARAIVRLAYRRRYWFARGFLFASLLVPLAVAFTAFKRNIPNVVPYYADPWFIEADRLLFLGHDPWRVTHALFGPTATWFLDRVYLMWFPASALLLGCFLFTRDHRFQLQGLLAYVLTWFVLGAILATAFASVGPVYYQAFYGSDQFAPLVASLKGHLFAPNIQARLLHSFGGTFIGSGISAMPSLHVAMAFLLFLASPRRLRLLAGGYVCLIWVASVHLGWHYAVDGLLSVVVVAAIWRATGAFVDRLDNRVKTRAPVIVYALDLSR